MQKSLPDTGFTVKDSGERESYDSGMVRDTTTGKIDYTLALDGPMFKRYAEHMSKGAVKYGKRNWTKANSEEERDRFRESALRHFLQWFWGDLDEDHAAAVFFNINAKEYTEARINEAPKECSYPGCGAAADAFVEEYMHMGRGTVWQVHPHWRS